MNKRKRELKLSLAKPGDPLVTSRGVSLLPDRRPTEDEHEYEDVPISINNFKATKQRSLKDLPAAVRDMRGIACVLVLTLLGVGDREIADGLGITLGELKSVRAHQGYDECMGMIVEELININSSNLAARIAAMSQKAMGQVFDIAMFAKKDETKLAANKDILDRSGAGVKELNAKRGLTDRALHIVMIDDDNGKRTVDITVGEEAEASV